MIRKLEVEFLPIKSNQSTMKSLSDLAASYQYTIRHIVPGPNSYSYFAAYLLLPAALLTPPSVLSRSQLALLFLPLIYACLIHAWWTVGVDVLSIDLMLWSFVMLVCRDPRRTHRRVWLREGVDDSKGGKGDGEVGKEVVAEEGYPEDLARRIPWVSMLLISLRLSGWKIGDPSHDRTQPPARISRVAFAKHAFSIALSSYCLLDVSSYYVTTDPYFTVSGMSVDHPFPSPSTEMATWLVLLRMLPPRLVRCSALAAQSYGMVSSLFYLPLLLMVGVDALGFLPHHEWSPHTWPMPYGPFSAVPERGLRGLWGTWWHGMNRQFSAAPGRWLTQALGIPTKSLRGYSLLTITAFFFSGLMHIGLVPPEPRSKTMSATWLRLYVAGFFWAQIPAFGIELAMSKLVARFIPQVLNWSMTRALVTIWTAAWLCLTLPILAVPFRELWYWHCYSVPVSLLRGILGKGWWTW